MTEVYLGLHIGEVFYGNIGSEDRLDFTVVGPAVNEVSRIAAMCRSVDRDVLLSSAFAAATPADASAPRWSRSAATRCAASAARRNCSRSIRACFDRGRLLADLAQRTSALRKRSMTIMNATDGTSRMSAVMEAIW